MIKKWKELKNSLYKGSDFDSLKFPNQNSSGKSMIFQKGLDKLTLLLHRGLGSCASHSSKTKSNTWL